MQARLSDEPGKPLQPPALSAQLNTHKEVFARVCWGMRGCPQAAHGEAPGSNSDEGCAAACLGRPCAQRSQPGIRPTRACVHPVMEAFLSVGQGTHQRAQVGHERTELVAVEEAAAALVVLRACTAMFRTPGTKSAACPT